MTFLYNIANATGNYLTAFVQEKLQMDPFISSFVTTPGILVAIVATPIFGMILSRKRQYKKIIFLWTIFAIAGFGVWWLCKSSASYKWFTYLILLIGYMIAGIATSTSQIAPYTYPIHSLPTHEATEGVSLIGWSGSLGAVVANGICGLLMHTDGEMFSVIRMAIVPALLMVIFAVYYRDTKQEA